MESFAAMTLTIVSENWFQPHKSRERLTPVCPSTEAYPLSETHTALFYRK